MKKTIPLCKAALLALAASFFGGCVTPVNTTFENAWTLGRNNMEILGAYSRYIVTSKDRSEHINDNFGARVGYGLSKNMDLKFRYEYLVADFEKGEYNAHYLEFYPKFYILPKLLTGMVPVSIYIYDNGESSTWVFSPRLLYSHAFNRNVEITLSNKMDFYLDQGNHSSLGFNLGLSVGKDVRSSLTFRPEVGLLFDPQEAGEKYWSFGMGLNYPIARR